MTKMLNVKGLNLLSFFQKLSNMIDRNKKKLRLNVHMQYVFIMETYLLPIYQMPILVTI